MDVANMDFDWKALVRSVAPTIGGALGTAVMGPGGGTALGAMALREVSTLLLGRPDASEPEIAEAVQNATPEQRIELARIDAQFKATLVGAGVEHARIEAGELANARQRQILMNDAFPNKLAVAILAGFFATLAAQFALAFVVSMMKLTILPEMLRVIDLLTGTMIGLALGIREYYYGSTRTSKSKDVVIDRLTADGR